MKDTLLSDLNRFYKLELAADSRYGIINAIVNEVRRLKYTYHDASESELISAVIRNKEPKTCKSKYISQSWSKESEILSTVNDEDVIESVKKSLKVSTKESINYIYLESLSQSQMMRVRVLTNLILMA